MASQRGHIVAAVGQIIYRSHAIRAVGVEGLAVDGYFYGLACGAVISHRHLMADAVASDGAHLLDCFGHVAAFDVNHRGEIIERHQHYQSSFGQVAFGEAASEAAFVDDSKVNVISER